MASTSRQPQLVEGVNQRLIRPLQDFLRTQAAAGALLVVAAVVAVVWANSPWSDSYVDLWNTEAGFDVGEFGLHLTLREWINDLAMVLFFCVVGLEIKREVVEGELRDPRQAALPIVGAIGGMVVPALIYAALNAGGDGSSGWGIPMATDIAIVAGVVALLGNHAPSWMRLFLLALAIVDDIGAIVVIAVFYSEGVSFAWLAAATAAIAAAAGVRRFTYWSGAFLALGAICWYGLHEAHVHPTLTGVIFGLLAPVTPRRTPDLIDVNALGSDPAHSDALQTARRARDSVSVVEWLEYRFHPYSAYVIVPVFALANAGVSLPASELGDAFSSSVTWGVILGLVVGKTVGISAATLLAVRLGVGKLPEGVTARYVIGAGAIAGIGFTVALFVTELAFGEGGLGNDARLGVLVASLGAAAIGAAIMLPGTFRHDHSMDDAQPPRQPASEPPD